MVFGLSKREREKKEEIRAQRKQLAEKYRAVAAEIQNRIYDLADVFYQCNFEEFDKFVKTSDNNAQVMSYFILAGYANVLIQRCPENDRSKLGSDSNDIFKAISSDRNMPRFDQMFSLGT